MNKRRIFVAAALLSLSLVYFVSAAPKHLTNKQKAAVQACDDDYDHCKNNITSNLHAGEPAYDNGLINCTDTYLQCLGKAYGAASVADPNGTPIQKQGAPDPTATPRQGPGRVSGKPNSNPTATPRKGPGKVSGVSGNSSSTSTSSGSVLLDKSDKPSPTPKPSPHPSRH